MENQKKAKRVHFNLLLHPNIHRELKEASKRTGISITRIISDGAILYLRELMRRQQSEIDMIEPKR